MLAEIGSSAFASAEAVLSIMNSPSIGLPCNTLISTVSKGLLGAVIKGTVIRGIPIACETYSEIGQNDIGKQIVIEAAGGVQRAVTIIDNVAPQPREWKIDGYITLQKIQYAVGLLKSGSELESVWEGVVKAGVNTTRVNEQVITMLVKVYFRYLRGSRSPFYFTTREGEQVQALIKEYEFIDEPTVENALHVKFTIVEYVSLTALDSVNTVSSVTGNVPSVGSLFGSSALVSTYAASAIVRIGDLINVTTLRNVDAAMHDVAQNVGTAVGHSASSASSASAVSIHGYTVVDDDPLDESVSEFTTNDEKFDVSFIDSDGKLVTTTVPSSPILATETEVSDVDAFVKVAETIGTSAVGLFELLKNDLHTDVAFVDSVFNGLETTNSDGDTEYLDTITVYVTYKELNMTIELRKTLLYKDWWLTVDGVLNGTTFSRTFPATFNTPMYRTGEVSLMMCTTAVSVDGTTFAELDDLSKSAALANAMLVVML